VTGPGFRGCAARLRQRAGCFENDRECCGWEARGCDARHPRFGGNRRRHLPLPGSGGEAARAGTPGDVGGQRTFSRPGRRTRDRLPRAGLRRRDQGFAGQPRLLASAQDRPRLGAMGDPLPRTAVRAAGGPGGRRRYGFCREPGRSGGPAGAGQAGAAAGEHRPAALADPERFRPAGHSGPHLAALGAPAGRQSLLAFVRLCRGTLRGPVPQPASRRTQLEAGPPHLLLVAVAGTDHRHVPRLVRTAAGGLAAADAVGGVPAVRRAAPRLSAVRRARVLRHRGAAWLSPLARG
jgi:hypothetical protein